MKWLWEYRSYVITIVTPLLILPLPLIANTSVCIQYFSDSSMLGVGGLMVAISVEQWNLHKRLAISVLLVAGVKPALLMLGFMSITAFLSMWITNMASTAIMLPIVQAVLEHLCKSEKEEEERELERHSAIKSLQVNKCKEGFNKMDIEEEPSPEKLLQVEQRRITREKKYRRLNKGISLSVCYAASIGGTATLTGSFPNLILKAQIDKIYPDNGDVLNYTSWFGFAFPNMVLMLIISWLVLQFIYLGFNVKNTFGCGTARNSHEDVYQVMRHELRKLGSMRFAEYSVLMLFILLVLLWFVTDSTVSILITFMFFIMPSKIPKCRHVGSVDITGKSEVRIPATLLNFQLVEKLLPWNILLLLGGAMALARGSEVSKLSFWLGQNLLPLGNIPPVALSFVLCLAVTLLTEVCNNAIISTVFLPVLASMAKALKIHPLSIMLPCAISASFAFMLPVATAPNAITFSYANLKIIDMFGRIPHNGGDNVSLLKSLVNQILPSCDSNFSPPVVNISLDQAPEMRWWPLKDLYSKDFLQKAAAQIIDSTVPAWVHHAIKPVVRALESYTPPPYAAEIRGMAKLYGSDISDILLLNFAYEVSAFCTSIVAQDTRGKIYHGRNLDYPHNVLKNLTIDVHFIKNGETLEGASDFLDAAIQLSEVPIITDVYYIVGGANPGEGLVITRDRSGPADIWPLDTLQGRITVYTTVMNPAAPEEYRTVVREVNTHLSS
ncbi:Solute carrier family 13 member 2 [Bagarius yarrelli]|uniref:Solute carrier family 13 member 2 n=1 Tax=Bagarius yarrelli TaxID=175774 RepID=A0A556U5F0_BAGYA|nr:Solute carrier family 13 member 2 [Bagarius yarrelli]